MEGEVEGMWVESGMIEKNTERCFISLIWPLVLKK